MRTAADILREQRQALAASRLNHRLTDAQRSFQAATSFGQAMVRPSFSTSDSTAAGAAVRNAADIFRNIEREKQKPCPTGYKRNASGECVLVIDTVPAGIPGRTEWRGPTLTQNKEATSFAQPLNRSAPLPGQAYSTVLSGLGYGKQVAPAPTCAVLLPYAADLEAKINANCALITKDGGATFDKTAALKVIADIRAACPAAKRSSQPSQPIINRDTVASWSTPSSGDVRLYGLGAMQQQPTANNTANPSDAIYRSLRERYIKALGQYNALATKYPGVRGECKVAPPPPDRTPEYCAELVKQRDSLMALIEGNCALLAKDPAAKATLYAMVNEVNIALRTFCGKQSGWSDAKNLAGLGFDLEDNTEIYRGLRDRYLRASAALRAAQRANPALANKSCAYVEGQASSTPIVTPASSSSLLPSSSTPSSGGPPVDVPPPPVRPPPAPTPVPRMKWPWIILAVGVGGYLFATKR